MTRNQLMASALSALMIATAVPAPALAEALDPSAGGAVADEQAVDGDEADDLGGPIAEEVPAGTEAEAEAVGEAPAGTEADEAAPAEKNEAADGETAPAAVETADPEAQAAPAAQAAGDPYEAEAPARDASAFTGVYGAVSYKYGANGSSNSTSILSAGNIASIGEPTKNEKGGWDVTVTLDAQATADDFGLRSWNVGGKNPESVYIDAAASKLTLTFSTDSATDGSWSCTGPARASIVFTDQASAQAPDFDLNNVVGKVLSYTINAGSLKPKQYGMYAKDIPSSMIDSISEPVQNAQGGWDITVTLKSGTAADYAVPEGYLRGFAADEMVIDPSAETKMQFTVSTADADATTWQCYASEKAEFTFIHEAAPAAPTVADVAAIQGAANYTLQNEDGSEAYSNRISIPENAIESVGKVYKAADGNYAVDVTVAAKTAPSDYGIEPPAFYGTAYELDEDASTLTMTLEYQDGAWTYTWPNVIQLDFAPVVGPAFDMSDQVNTANNVAYVVYDENGEQEYAGSASLASLGGLVKVTSVGKPAQQEDGTWAVDVTLADNTLTSLDQTSVPAYLLKHDKTAYVLDLASSDLTGTYRTTGSGTTYTIAGSDRPTFVFRYQAPAQAPAFNIANELNVYGTVTYTVKKADGTTYENGTHLVSADNVESVGTPYQTEDGCWAVDVTLKADPAPDDYAVPSWVLDDGDYTFDADASDLTLTFRTLSSEGTTWYCSGAEGVSARAAPGPRVQLRRHGSRALRAPQRGRNPHHEWHHDQARRAGLRL